MSGGEGIEANSGNVAGLTIGGQSWLMEDSPSTHSPVQERAWENEPADGAHLKCLVWGSRGLRQGLTL